MNELSPHKNEINVARFFKKSTTDQFLNISNPTLRQLAKKYFLSFSEILELLQSEFNEIRMLGLFILERHKDPAEFYIQNLNYVNNWNLVDCSAYKILGKHLYQKDRSLLFDLAKSPNLWHRRVAIVTTYYFIKKNDLKTTFELTAILSTDKEDYIQKAVGWMLREAGKKDENRLVSFLKTNKLFKTAFSYATERIKHLTI